MKITIEISQTIRVVPYEMIKPGISMEFEVPEGIDIKEFYKEKYKEVKQVWNMHLYNLLFDTSQRSKAQDAFDYAKTLILEGEKFPTFRLKNDKGGKEDGKEDGKK